MPLSLWLKIRALLRMVNRRLALRFLKFLTFLGNFGVIPSGLMSRLPSIPVDGHLEHQYLEQAQYEHDRGEPFNAIRAYGRLLELQVEREREHIPYRTDPPLRALVGLADILREEFPDFMPLKFDDSEYVRILDAIESPRWGLSREDTMDLVRVLASYLTITDYGWREGDAGKLYRWMLATVDDDISTSYAHMKSYILQELTKLYISDRQSSLPDSEKDTVFQRYIEENEREGKVDEGTLELRQSIASWYICCDDPESVDTGEDMLCHVYDLQREHLGVRHPQTTETLLSLRYHYQRQGRDVEAASLLWEVAKNYTDADDPVETAEVQLRDYFLGSRTPRARVQNALSSISTPGENYHWKESRVYLQDISHIQLAKLEISDPFPGYPMLVTLRGGTLEVHVPQRYRPIIGESEADISALIATVQNSRVWHFLNSKAIKNDWSPFENTVGMLNIKYQPARSTESQIDTSSSPIRDLNFWLFPEVLDTIGEAHLVKRSSNQRSGSNHPHISYRFSHVLESREPNAESEFIVARDDQGSTYNTPEPESEVLSALHYRVEENDEGNIDITCPYITYAQFQRSRGYRCDFKYTDYMELVVDLCAPRSSYRQLRYAKRKFCSVKPAKMANTKISRCTPPPRVGMKSGNPESNFEAVDGFFNSIPGDSALIDIGNVAGGFDLVSSAWVDWENFILHECPAVSCPRLQGNDGASIRCHGYISGRWISGGLTEAWITAKLFVVDAVFAADNDTEECHNFLFSSNERVKYKPNTVEKRLLLGKLNPTFFHYVSPRYGALTVWRKTHASKKSPNIQDEMMAELDRRERWDRVYERNQLYLSDEEKKKDLEQEMQKRLEWDTNHKLRLNVAPAK